MSDIYENYRQALLAGGASEEDVKEAVEAARAEGAKIDALVCPSCGARLTKVLDSSQAGPTEIAGK